MRKYLKTIYQRSEQHKRRFALVTSGLITLFIFSLWSMVAFSNMPNFEDKTNDEAQVISTGVSPFESIWSDVSGTVGDIKNQLTDLKNTAEDLYYGR
jgi:cell shape-determining protein MreC